MIDYVDNIPPSLTLADMREGVERSKESLRNDIESRARHILEQRVEYCKKAGITQTTLKIAFGKVADEIIRVAEEMECDVIVMASSRMSSFIRALGSNARKPVLIIHE